jgi:predicted O-methyltransferase YrrM
MGVEDIPGFLEFADRHALVAAALDVLQREVPGDFVEVGSYQGRSTVPLGKVVRDLARNGRRVLTIDPHAGLLDMPGGTQRQVAPSLAQLHHYLEAYGVTAWVDVHVGTVDTAPLPAQISLAFIDGAHDRASVLHDADMLLPQMADGGLMLFHDYNGDFPGVAAAVDAFYERHARLDWLTPAGSLARLRVRKQAERATDEP